MEYPALAGRRAPSDAKTCVADFMVSVEGTSNPDTLRFYERSNKRHKRDHPPATFHTAHSMNLANEHVPAHLVNKINTLMPNMTV